MTAILPSATAMNIRRGASRYCTSGRVADGGAGWLTGTLIDLAVALAPAGGDTVTLLCDDIASEDCPPEKITEFVLMTGERPMMEVVAVYVCKLAFGSGIPAGIKGMIPTERHWKQRSSQAPIFAAI